MLKDLYLEPTEKYTPRLDIPVLRNFTWDEAHAFQIGFYAMSALALLNEAGGGVSVVLGLALVTTIYRKYLNGEETVPHELRGAITQVWYIGFGALVSAVILGTVVL